MSSVSPAELDRFCYVGAHLGGAWAGRRGSTAGRRSSYVGDTTWFPFGNKTTPSGFIGGGQVALLLQLAVWRLRVRARRPSFSDCSGSQSTSQTAGPDGHSG